MDLLKYFSILVEWNIDSIGGERYLFFDSDRARLFTEFTTRLKTSVTVFIDYHSEEFSLADCSEWCEQYPELGLDPENRKFDDSLKIINHIIEKGKDVFISEDNVDLFFAELDDILDWISSVPSYPNRDFIHIPIKGNYPDFIEMWYEHETRSPVLPLQYNIGIGDSSYKDEDATILGWICTLVHSKYWYEKPDAIKFVFRLVERFNRRHEFT